MHAVVIVHGGAGNVPEARRPLHAEGCGVAAQAGLEAARSSGDPIAAVIAAVRALEDDPKFNAGHGACLTADGTLELDASLMVGADLSLGAVAALPPYPNPIAIADAVRRDGRHCLYAGAGADRFARAAGFSSAEAESMITQSSRDRLARVLAGEEVRYWAGNTVGAVAFVDGRLAAGTSTGGTVGKLAGRVGDTPIAGAGTWADDGLGACSTTGVGEAIMRFGLARDAVERLRASDAQAGAEASIAAFGDRVAGSGGLILISAKGEPAFARNTATMSWAIARGDAPVAVGY